MERRTQEERRAVTRGALVSAARELFVSEGYVGASQEEIVGRAGLTRGALYHHFGDGKRGLFREVVEQIEVEIDEVIVEAARTEYERSADMGAAWMAGNRAYLGACTRPDVRRVLFGDASAALGFEEWREIDAAHGLPQIEQGLRLLIERGVMEPQPVKLLAHLWYGATTEAGMYVAAAEDPAAAIEEAQEALQKMFYGMLDGDRER